MADRLAVIESGVIRQIGTPEEVYNHPVDIFVASFLGTPKINLIEGTIVDNQIMPFGWPVSMLPSSFAGKDKFIIGIRPEDILISAGGDYSGTIKSLEYLGDRAVAAVESKGFNLTAVTEPDRIEPGNNIKFAVNKEKLLFFEKK
jgi:ABC-type sugar transport system ATPase subunit